MTERRRTIRTVLRRPKSIEKKWGKRKQARAMKSKIMLEKKQKRWALRSLSHPISCYSSLLSPLSIFLSAFPCFVFSLFVCDRMTLAPQEKLFFRSPVPFPHWGSSCLLHRCSPSFSASNLFSFLSPSFFPAYLLVSLVVLTLFSLCVARPVEMALTTWSIRNNWMNFGAEAKRRLWLASLSSLRQLFLLHYCRVIISLSSWLLLPHSDYRIARTARKIRNRRNNFGSKAKAEVVVIFHIISKKLKHTMIKSTTTQEK